MLHHFDAWAALIGLLIVTFLFVNGLLWFKDVFEIIRKLRTRHRESKAALIDSVL